MLNLAYSHDLQNSLADVAVGPDILFFAVSTAGMMGQPKLDLQDKAA